MLTAALAFGALISYGCARAKEYMHHFIGAACWSALLQFEQMKDDLNLLMPVSERDKV